MRDWAFWNIISKAAADHQNFLTLHMQLDPFFAWSYWNCSFCSLLSVVQTSLSFASTPFFENTLNVIYCYLVSDIHDITHLCVLFISQCWFHILPTSFCQHPLPSQHIVSSSTDSQETCSPWWRILTLKSFGWAFILCTLQLTIQVRYQLLTRWTSSNFVF